MRGAGFDTAGASGRPGAGPHSRSSCALLQPALITAQEDERRRMARELHDDLAQRLALLEYQLADSRQQVRSNPALVEGLLDRLIGLAAGISDEVRQLSHRLHPSILDDLGLVPALRSLCEEFERTYGVDVHVITEVPSTQAIPLPIATALYRISQEGLRNAAKHGLDASVIIGLLTTGAGYTSHNSRFWTRF